MKRTLFRLSVALLTLALGITITEVLRSHRAIEQVSSPSPQAVLPAPVPATANDQSNQAQVANYEVEPLEAAYIDGDKLSYHGYDVERTTQGDRYSTATIKKNGRVIATLRNGGLGKESTRFGLFSLLGGESKQLVIMQYTGGAHCCWTYRIYDFQPHLHVIFDDENYGLEYLGYELNAEDINGDGVLELSQAVMTFDYFHMSHASSVFPTAVFSYDRKSRAYIPANERFLSYALDEIDNDLKALKLVSRNTDGKGLPDHEEYLSAVLKVLLKRIYAGDEANAWKFFDAEYQLGDKVEIKSDIKKALRGDPIYTSLYRARH